MKRRRIDKIFDLINKNETQQRNSSTSDNSNLNQTDFDYCTAIEQAEVVFLKDDGKIEGQ